VSVDEDDVSKVTVRPESSALWASKYRTVRCWLCPTSIDVLGAVTSTRSTTVGLTGGSPPPHAAWTAIVRRRSEVK
jgi:hypothetical protein